MFKDIERKEWIFLAVVWLISAVVAFLPMAIGYFMTPVGSIFLFRRSLNTGDYSVYFSQIDQAKHGIFFFKDLFTQESQTFGVLNPLWYLVGILANIFSLSSFVVLQLASFLLIPVYLLSAYCLISYFLNEKNKRKICFILFVFASGIGWWISFFNYQNFLSPSIQDAEAFSPAVLSSPPHYIASITLLILVFLFSFYAIDRNKLKYSFWAGFCALLLFSFHPYHVYTVFGVLFVFLMAEFLIEKKVYIKHIAHYVILLIFSTPPIIYYLWVFSNIPVRQQTFSHNITLTPALWIVLTDYSIFLILAVLGIVSFLKGKDIDKKKVFLIVWVITQFFLIYLPINTNKRLLEGLNIPLIILATYGLFFIFKNQLEALFAGRKEGFYGISEYLENLFKVVLFFVVLFCISNVMIFLNDIYFFKYYSAAYLPIDSESAMLWIRKNTPIQSVILSSFIDQSSYIDGNIIPLIAFRPVYYGHGSETAYPLEKKEMMDNFFKKYNSAEREEFLKENNISYLFWGPEEKEMADNFNPDEESYLQKVYSNNSVSVYKFNDN